MLKVKDADLIAEREALEDVRIADLFVSDPERFSRFSVQLEDLLFDYSKQKVTHNTIEKLCALARDAELAKKREAFFSGQKINISEDRAVLHPELRDPKPSARIASVLERMAVFFDTAKQQYEDVLCLGIGGSELGPVMTTEALKPYKNTALKLHFISNVDGYHLASCLKNVNPNKTLCIISSKTFTTPETLENAKTVKAWFLGALGSEDKVVTHIVGVTAHPKRALDFGIKAENIFEFWEEIGGRYSIWSSVGLPLILSIGILQFKEFLKGAHTVDNHFRRADFSENIPVLMALLGIWNNNILGYPTKGLMVYDDNLKYFPSYLQQLEMESNGKSVGLHGESIQCRTAPVIWGGVGCNGQHAFMQMLHQGTEIVPLDFLIAVNGHSHLKSQQQLLLASCFSQGKALMEGSGEEVDDFKFCEGNRPSSTLIYSKLKPYTLGMLIALYEHKVFVEGVIWGINSFDQWGVELGKKLAKEILPNLDKNPKDLHTDGSTQGLVAFLQQHKEK